MPHPRRSLGQVLGPGAVTQGSPRLEIFFRFAAGAAEPVSSSCSDKERGTTLLGEGVGVGRGRPTTDGVAVKTLIAAFWDRSGFLSYLQLPNNEKSPSCCAPTTSGQG